jgi:hypothetical protein
VWLARIASNLLAATAPNAEDVLPIPPTPSTCVNVLVYCLGADRGSA